MIDIYNKNKINAKKNIIGYCVGVFDQLHYGHKNILTLCSRHCDKLIVGVHTDKFVQSYKRLPTYNEETRKKLIIDFLGINPDYVRLIDDNHIKLIKEFNINKIFHGTDWEIESYKKQIKYYEYGMDKLGIDICLIPYTKGISTTNIITSKVRNLNNKKCFLFDLDNTLVLNNKATLFADDIINKLKVLNKDYYVITNNNRYSPINIKKLLDINKIYFDEDKIITTLSVIKNYLSNEKITNVFVWGTNEAIKYLENYGIYHDPVKAEIILVLYNNLFNYQKLVELINLIKKKPYIVGNIDLTYPDSKLILPDTGSIAKLIKLFINKDPVKIFGKPDISMTEHLFKKYDKKDMILIGDSELTDKKLAKNMNIDFLHINNENGDISNLGVICDYLN